MVYEIPTYGIKMLTLDLELRRPFQWSFVLAKVSKVIIVALPRFEAVIEINYDAIAEEQVKDEELKQLMQNNLTLKFKPSTLPSEKTLWWDISTSKIKPYIPQKFRLQMLQLKHGFALPGVKSTIKLMTENMSAPDERFSVVHIDLIGPLPPSEGIVYCLICIDRLSCWMEVVPLSHITAKIVGKASYEHWICWSHNNLPAPPPQLNGEVERLHRTLKGAIKAHNNIKWTESLPTVLLVLRAALRPDVNHTIAQIVYDTCIKLSVEFFDPPTINKSTKFYDQITTTYERHKTTEVFQY
ncbi:retrovirus-related Pol polyprotein from transposon opus [Nephila pilipes]|uniref:Retrovirus-related Pol polyprotein from transposon opus n=1 Tax=Nephila pilipes TaxID=299642 RepID=A0A8X6K0W7_NEPPI|nr:retrovirus-related Pol polyprotein from transposon opus [Nephila pilipes]